MSQVQVVINFWALQTSFSIGITDALADPATMRQIENIINGAKEQVRENIRTIRE